MTEFFADLRESFKHGVLNATTPGAKFRRWAVLVTLWATTLAFWTVSGVAFTEGEWFVGSMFVIWGYVPGAMSAGAIFSFSTAELRKDTARLRAETEEIMRRLNRG